MDKIRLIIVAAVVFLLGLFYLHRFIFFSHELVLTVEKNDAPTGCNTHRRKWMGGRTRSSVPETQFAGFCGVIMTDKGHYKLRDEKYHFTLHEDRARLDEALVEGCTFRVFIVGYGPKFAEGDIPRYPISQMISRILEHHGCDNR